MKALKYIVLILLILFIGCSTYVAVQPNSYDISRTRTINAPSAVIYNEIIDFKNWSAWSPWSSIPRRRRSASPIHNRRPSNRRRDPQRICRCGCWSRCQCRGRTTSSGVCGGSRLQRLLQRQANLGNAGGCIHNGVKHATHGSLNLFRARLKHKRGGWRLGRVGGLGAPLRGPCRRRMHRRRGVGQAKLVAAARGRRPILCALI